jgi:NAD+--asparagine ADP-ribosyltransferase
MSRAPQRPKIRAGLGLTLLFVTTMLLLGIGLDFATASGSRFWIDQQPGMLALFSAGVALASVLLAHAVRVALGRRAETNKGERDADA